MKGNDYSVYIGTVLIGYARDVEDDMPVTKGKFEPTQQFEGYRSLFVQAYQLLRDEKHEDRVKTMDKIMLLGLRLESPRFGVLHGCNSSSVIQPGGFVFLYIHDDNIWWRPC